MLKNILNLNGVQLLSRNEQRTINGGIHKCGTPCTGTESCCSSCGGGYYCPHVVPGNGIE